MLLLFQQSSLMCDVWLVNSVPPLVCYLFLSSPVYQCRSLNSKDVVGWFLD